MENNTVNEVLGAAHSTDGVTNVTADTVVTADTIPPIPPNVADVTEVNSQLREANEKKVEAAAEEYITKEGNKYSVAELKQIMTIGKSFAQRTIFNLLFKMLDKVGTNHAKKTQRMLKNVLEYNTSNFDQLEFSETKYKLNITLSLCERTYVPEIAIPNDKAAKELLSRFAFIKTAAGACWVQFCEEHKSIFNRLCDDFKGVDLNRLTVDTDKPTQLYFDPDFPICITVFPFWVDEMGNPLRIKKNK